MSKRNGFIIISLILGACYFFMGDEKVEAEPEEESLFKVIKDESVTDDIPEDLPAKAAQKKVIVDGKNIVKPTPKDLSDLKRISSVLTKLKDRRNRCQKGIEELLPGGADIFDLEESFQNNFTDAIDTLDEMMMLFSASLDGTGKEFNEVSAIGATALSPTGAKLVEAYNFEVCPYEMLVTLFELVMEEYQTKLKKREKNEFKSFLLSSTLNYVKFIVETVPNSHHLMQAGYLLRTLASNGFFNSSEQEEINFLVQRNVEEGQHLAVGLVQGEYKGKELIYFKESMNVNSIAKDEYMEILGRLMESNQISVPFSMQR